MVSIPQNTRGLLRWKFNEKLFTVGLIWERMYNQSKMTMDIAQQVSINEEGSTFWKDAQHS